MATGGLTKGKSHAEGGIPMKVKSTGQNIEVEGGEVIINKKSVSDTKKHTFDGQQLTKCEIASKINEADGNGVKLDCDSVEGKKYKYQEGGKTQQLDEVFDDYYKRGGNLNFIYPKNSLGYEKKDLPQIRTGSKGLFIEYLNNKYGRQITSYKDVQASELKPVQNKINKKQLQIIKDYGGLANNKPITVSNDGYVIDGHHRWYYAKEQGISLPSLIIDLPAEKVIEESFNSGLAERENIDSVRNAYADGGKVSKEYSTKEIPLSLYKSFFQDTDKDGVPNVDDVAPFKSDNKERLEEVSLSDEMKVIIDYRNDFEKIRKQIVDDLENVVTECDGKGECGILSRTKTPYSIINKLRRRSLTNVKDLEKLDKKAEQKLKSDDLTGLDLYKGLTDVVGAMVVTPDKKNADKIKDVINSGKLGRVLEFEDFYKNDNNGYRAFHFLIAVEKDGKIFPVEVQVKTKRVKRLAGLSHTVYKNGNLNAEGFDKLNQLALKSDMGDVKAQKEFDEIVGNRKKVMGMIAKKTMETGGVITNTTQFNEYAKFENDAEELQESEYLFDEDLFQNPDKFQEELDVAIDNSYQMRKDYQKREYDYIKAKEKSDDKIKADKRRKAKELLKKYELFAKGGQLTSYGLSFTKDDYDVNVDANDGENNIEVDVNIKKSDSVNQLALSETNAKWTQFRWGYIIYPKDKNQLYQVLKALKVNVSKKRLDSYFENRTYAKGGRTNLSEQEIEKLKLVEQFKRGDRDNLPNVDSDEYKREKISELMSMQEMRKKYEQGGMITGNPIEKLVPYLQLQALKEGEREIKQGLREEPLFLDDLNNAYNLIPPIYTQDGKRKNAVVYLHYFNPSSDWYITELDKETNEGYGYVILNGDTQFSEFGYIPLEQLTEQMSNVNVFAQPQIDQFFKPKTLNQVFQSKYPELVEGEVEIYEDKKEVEVIETSDYLNMDFKNPYERNIVIRNLIDEKGDNENNYSIDEKEFIQLYSGMGGLEKFGAKEGLLYEYYTPKDIVQKMWGLAFKHKLGTQKIETCLEPSVATGNFVGYAPDNVKMIGYDIDKYAYSICNVLYGNNDMHEFYNMSFEKLFINNRNKSVGDKVEPFCDLVIGNPPYGKYSGLYAGMGEKKHTQAEDYIDYFIFRSLDLLKSGGLLVFIIGKLTQLGGVRFTDQISKNPNKCQMKIRKKSNLVDAYRLPVGVFDTTDVESEIIVLRKK